MLMILRVTKMTRGYFKNSKLCIALQLPDGFLYKNHLREVQVWPQSEDYVAESFNNYYLGGAAKIVFVNKWFEIVK
jgi:hypothetical protein